MPINLQLTAGLLDDAAQQRVFARLTDLFLDLHGLADNAFLRPNVIGEVHTIAKGKSFSGGEPDDIAVVELKVPAFALQSSEQKSAWVAGATAILLGETGGRLRRDRIYANMTYAIDGLWGIDGQAYTNDALQSAVAAAAVAAA